MRKRLRVLAAIAAFICLILALDMAIGGSVFHPLTYLYKLQSWFTCKFASIPSCNNTAQNSSGTPVPGKNGMVVTEQRLASEVGLQILKQGGNAVDAAVAVGYALAVTHPCCGNLGGGGFMLIHLANGKDTFINFREKAPLAATRTMYLDKQGNVVPGRSSKGYLAVGVPGTVLGLDQALSTYGTLSRTTVMAPAIELAQKGFVLQPGDVKILNLKTEGFKKQPNVPAIFLKNGTTPYQAGERLVQKDLANTLELIAKQGPNAFYKGAITDEIVNASRSNGGILAKEDFANYIVSETAPVRCTYRSYQVISAPPPGGGTTLCQMLNILEGYNLKQLGFRSAPMLHRMLSAMLYAYADRNTYLGDPDFVDNPVERLLSKEYAAQVRAKISENRAVPPEPLFPKVTTNQGNHTTHYSIQDRYGNAVSVTYTINSFFGAGVIAGNTGFFLNNEMDDFTSKPGVPNNFGLVQGNANIIEPGKRPLSSMSPTIVTQNNKVFLVTGSPGGSTIPTTILQVITNVVDYGMNIQQAVDTPRIHYQGLPNVVGTEPYALKSAPSQQLWQWGYKIVPLGTWGAAESLLVNPDSGLLDGANDSRRPAGAALGY
jgi:gamma-glutamyltranspeptidase / glutathione hydrolase